jgi:hypothetical protein
MVKAGAVRCAASVAAISADDSRCPISAAIAKLRGYAERGDRVPPSLGWRRDVLV